MALPRRWDTRRSSGPFIVVSMLIPRGENESASVVAAFTASAALTANAALLFFSCRRRHTRFDCDWSSDVCSSDLHGDHFLRRFGDFSFEARDLLFRLIPLNIALQRDLFADGFGGFGVSLISERALNNG